MILDIKTAFLYGDSRRPLYMELPSEDPLAASGEFVAKLVRSLYGTRDAPQIWQDHLRRSLQNLGFREAVSTPGVFVHQQRGLELCVHVDDLMVVGARHQLEWLRGRLEQQYVTSGDIMGKTST